MLLLPAAGRYRPSSCVMPGAPLFPHLEPALGWFPEEQLQLSLMQRGVLAARVLLEGSPPRLYFPVFLAT